MTKVIKIQKAFKNSANNQFTIMLPKKLMKRRGINPLECKHIEVRFR